MIVATDVLSKVITKPVEDAIKTIAKKATDYLVDRGAKNQIDIGVAYKDYLNNVYGQNVMSKSFLYRDEDRKLSSFFVPLTLKPLSWESRWLKHDKDYSKEDDKLSAKNIADLLKQGNKLIITGTGGMGKTLHMKYFCVSAIECKLKVPVFISLRCFNDIDIDSKSFEEHIYEQLKICGFKLEFQYFKYSLDSDKYLFLFDGYDEIKEKKKPQLSAKLIEFAKQYSKNSFIISSRPSEELFSWERFKIFSICKMSIEQIIDVIWMLDYKEGFKKKFSDILIGDQHSIYKDFASIPLLLSILIITYAANDELPETLNEFYEKAFEVLLLQKDKEKIGFKRDFQSRLTTKSFKEVFLCFCYITYLSEMYSFSHQALEKVLSAVFKKMEIDIDEDAYINDLVNISCMLVQEGEDYFFLHRNFQQYFAASYVSGKNVDEQRKMCHRYIKSKDYININSDEGYYDRYGFVYERNHNLDFFVLLKSIESDRFESIILIPIMKKIYDAYQKDNDLVLVTLIFNHWFCKICSLIDNGPFRDCGRFLSYDSHKEGEIDFLFSEFELLKELLPFSDKNFNINCIDNKKLYEQTMMVTSREYFYKYYRKAKKPRALETFARPYSFYCGELRYTAMVIDRYEKLC